MASQPLLSEDNGPRQVSFSPASPARDEVAIPLARSLSKHADAAAQEMRNNTRFSASLAFLALGIFLASGYTVFVVKHKEFTGKSSGYAVIDALYFCVAVMTTVGYGDVVPNTESAKIFASIFAFAGFAFFGVVFGSIIKNMVDDQEARAKEHYKTRLQQRHMQRAKSAGDMVAGSTAASLAHQSAAVVVAADDGVGLVKVAISLCVVVLCILAGATGFVFIENRTWLDGFYGSIISMTTVGFGDVTFETAAGRLFCAIWLFVGTLSIGAAYIFASEAWLNYKSRGLVDYIVTREITTEDFEKANIDRDGEVTEAEFVLYKLAELDMVDDRLVSNLRTQFQKYDANQDGKLTWDEIKKASPN